MVINMEGLWAGILGVGGGITWFMQGFRELKSSRTIQNIPTSRIMTGAVGTNVEIKGKVLVPGDNVLRAPISGQTCAFFSIEIQRLVRSKDRSYWKKVDQIYSSEEFYMEDGSGAMARVFIEGADIQLQGKVKTFQIRSNDLSAMPEGLFATLRRNEDKLKVFKLKNSAWLFSQEYRFIEWRFQSGESVYVLGFAESGTKPPRKNKLKFTQFLQAKKMIEKDPGLQTRFDRNHDGVLDAEELEKGAQIVGIGLQTEPARQKESLIPVKMIFKKHRSFAFLISNIKEKDLVRKLSLKAALKVWGGPVLALASSAYLIYTLNMTG